MTRVEALDLRHLPEHLIVLGAGFVSLLADVRFYHNVNADLLAFFKT